MGLISTPFRGLLSVFKEISERAEKEIYDEEGVKAQLMEAYKMLEAGSLSEESFAQRESELVLRLEEIEQHKEWRAGRAAH
jgi:hypothetical protein